MALLNRYDCPLVSYEAIMSWARFATSLGFKFDAEEQRQRVTAMKELTKRLGMEKLRPFEKSVVWSGSNDIAKVVCFPFKHHLLKVLSDPLIMRPENLVVNQPDSGHDPYGKFHPSESGLPAGYTHSGTWFQKAWDYLEVRCGMFVLAFSLFIDASGIDLLQRFSLEPVGWSLTLLKPEVRRKFSANFTLAFLPKLDKGSSAQAASTGSVSIPAVFCFCFYQLSLTHSFLLLLFRSTRYRHTNAVWMRRWRSSVLCKRRALRCHFS
jgi:hypothetical protein